MNASIRPQTQTSQRWERANARHCYLEGDACTQPAGLTTLHARSRAPNSASSLQYPSRKAFFTTNLIHLTHRFKDFLRSNATGDPP